MQNEVNVNDPKFQAMINKSKAVMSHVESKNPSRGSKLQEGQTPQSYEEREPPMMPEPRSRRDDPLDPGSAEYQARLKNSKLPAAIRESMMQNPLNDEPYYPEPQQRSYTAEEMNSVQAPAPTPRPQPIQEQRQQPGISNREEMKDLIKEVLAEMMVNTISESVVKKTLKTLMNEGKIRAKAPAQTKQLGRKI